MRNKILNGLKKDGFIVIPNVLSTDEILKTESLFWDKLESLNSGINRNDNTTWTNDNWPGNLRVGFMGNHGLSQSKAAWYVRSNKKLIDIFSQIWNTDGSDLITSMDAIICWRKWLTENSYIENSEDSNDSNEEKQNNQFYLPIVEGLHVDQSPFNEGFQCVQGMVIINEVTDYSGGLQIIPKSHTESVQWHMRQNYKWSKNSDFVELDTDDVLFNFYKPQLLKCKPGDLILWDSRLIHGGFVGIGYDLEDMCDNTLARLAFPVSMMPRKLASEDILIQRLHIFNKGYTTTHWVSKCNINNIADSDTHGFNIIYTDYVKPFDNHILI
jgi:hypothetical protein